MMVLIIIIIIIIIIIMTPVPAGVCSQGHHSHNTSHGDWRHNPETANQQSQFQLQKL